MSDTPIVIAGTGHRPPKLHLDYSPASRKLLVDLARKELEKIDEVGRVLSGMAQGWDQALAEAALSLGIPLVAVLPYVGFHDRWPKEAQDRFERLCRSAISRVVVCDGGHANYKYIRRDEYLVNNCTHLLALYDEQEGHSGTGQTVAYARRKGVPVINAWERWAER